jgi:hypothetical protein
MANKKKKSIQMAKPNKEEGWFDGKKVIPFGELDESYLQNILTRCEKKELFYFNQCQKFSKLIDKIMDEAERRGVMLIIIIGTKSKL